MIIDIHTHIFPDSIAERTIAALEAKAHIKAAASGTLDGLLASAKEGHVDYCIVMPVVTKPSQFQSVNQFAAKLNQSYREGGEQKLISFGGIHPETADYKEELHIIKELGLPGIKLHPDYQSTRFDDIRYKRIVEEATRLGLVVLVHAGVDIGLPEPVHCTPKMAREMLDEVQPEQMILAHYGGYALWDEVEEYLVGQKVYFDTAYTEGKISEEQFLRILKHHGADKILFGTDSPWCGQKETVETIKALPISQEDKDLILGGNAARMLLQGR